jgi:hypothetical protein
MNLFFLGESCWTLVVLRCTMKKGNSRVAIDVDYKQKINYFARVAFGHVFPVTFRVYKYKQV